MSADPVLAPDRRHLVTADFCPAECDNEVVVWRVTRDDIWRALVWKPNPAWSDASAHWKDADTLLFDYSLYGDKASHTLARRLSDPGWQKVSAR